jgi:hypothetical protein
LLLVQIAKDRLTEDSSFSAASLLIPFVLGYGLHELRFRDLMGSQNIMKRAFLRNTIVNQLDNPSDECSR